MTYTTNDDPIDSAELRLALTESFPDASYGAVPVSEYGGALETYRAFDDGTLAEAPHAFAAYLSQQRFNDT